MAEQEHPAAPTPVRSRTPNRPAGLNRTILALLGLAMLAGGLYALLRGLGLIPFGGATVRDPASTLLPTTITSQAWAAYAIITCAGVIGVLCLLWLLAQLGRRRPASRTWRLTGDPETGGTTYLDTDSAADAFADEVQAYTGVHRAHAAITGEPSHATLHLTVTTDADTSITALRERIDTTALPRLCQSLELERIPAEILFVLGTSHSRLHPLDEPREQLGDEPAGQRSS